jgi:hypothetical protein
MRQPGSHWVVALFFELPAGPQTRPVQHCASLSHFDCDSGAAGLQSLFASAGRAAMSNSTAKDRQVNANKRVTTIPMRVIAPSEKALPHLLLQVMR